MDHTETAPDLIDGIIVNGLSGENLWTTEIQSVLEEERDGKTETRYLSHQCRRENVPFSDGYLGDTDQIFQTTECSEFLTFTHNGYFHQLPDADTAVPAADIEGLMPEWNGGQFFPNPVTWPNWTSEVACGTVPIRAFEFDEAFNGLVHRALPLRKLFLRVEWSDGDTRYRLYCPCRYVNYANPKTTDRRYVQPISGYVLVPLEGVLCRGYVACAMNDSGETIIETLMPRFHSPYGKLVKAVTGNESPEIVNQLHSNLPAVIRSFDVVKRVEGRFNLFVYA